MDDWLRYEDTGSNTIQRMGRENELCGSYLTNTVNMGQISSNYIGNTSWRYTIKGGYGAPEVSNDGETRVQNNGWNDFSGK